MPCVQPLVCFKDHRKCHPLSDRHKHISTNELFSPFQSAYRPGHSTETALLKVLSDLLHSLDHGNVSVVTLRLTYQLLLTQSTIPFYSNVRNMFLAYTVLLYTGFLLTSQTEQKPYLCPSAHLLWSPTGICSGPCSFCLIHYTPLYVIDSHSVLHHSFADDSQLQKSAPPQQLDEVIQSMQECIHDVKLWMTHNKLKVKLNDKTEALIISAPMILNSIPLPDSLVVGNLTVRFSQSAKNLGVTLDMHLTMAAHGLNC